VSLYFNINEGLFAQGLVGRVRISCNGRYGGGEGEKLYYAEQKNGARARTGCF
jgi:hypothetical protein